MAKPCTPRGELRREAFIAAARKLLNEKGIEGLQVNDIVGLAGGSLSTLYAYFPTKNDVLEAVAMHGGFQEPLQALASPRASVRQTLVAAATEYAHKVLEPENLGTLRALLACAPSHSEVVTRAMVSRRDAIQAEMSRYLRTQCAAGTLLIDDMQVAVVQFQSLVCGPWFYAALYGASHLTTAPYVRSSIEDGVATFLCRYANPAAGRVH